MIQISFDKLIVSKNKTDYKSWRARLRTKTWWQENTERKLEGRKERFAYLIVLIKLYFGTQRTRDIDNYMGSVDVKGIIDGIVSCELIPDDDAAHLNYSVDLLIDKENPRTEVILYGTKENNEYFR